MRNYFFMFWLDIIGYVHDIGYCQVNQGTSKKLQVNLVLKDLRYVLQYCATIHNLIPSFFEKYYNLTTCVVIYL